MRHCVLALTLLAAAPGASAAQLNADYLFRPGVISLTLMGGGVAFSDFRREAEWIDTDQAFERRLSASTSVLAAGAVTYWLGRRWGVRLHASYAPSRFEVRSTESYTVLEEQREQEEPSLSRLDIWMYDADLLFRLPISVGRVQPYGVLGAGAVEYHLRTGDGELVPPEVEIAFQGKHKRRFAAVIGLGALVPLQRHGLLLNFELSNHLTRTPLYEDALPELALDPESEDRVDEVGYTSSVRLMLGVTIPLRMR